MMRTRFSRLLVYVFLFSFMACKTTGKMEGAQVNWKKIQVLVYTKNGKGFVHDNIPNAVAAFQKMGKEHGFTVDVSDDPAVFTEGNLQKYAALIFTSTNNEVFDTEKQKVAFMRYIQSGGGFMGVHSSIGTERKWTWFKQLQGGTFAWHARSQSFKVMVIDAAHPSVKDVPKVWTRFDECYFSKELYPGIKVVMAHDVTSLNPDQDSLIKKNMGSYGNIYPAVWYQDYDGGHVWFTALGHHKEDYLKPDLVNHLYQGLHWLVGQTSVRDLSKAYATSPETPVRY